MLTTPEAPIGNQLSTTPPSTQGTQPIRGLPLVPSASQFLVQRIELGKQRRHGLIQLANTPGSTPSLPIQRQPDGLCDLSSTDGPWCVCRWLATIKCNATVCPKPACVAGIWFQGAIGWRVQATSRSLRVVQRQPRVLRRVSDALSGSGRKWDGTPEATMQMAIMLAPIRMGS